MATRDDNIIAEEARAIEVGEETAVGAPNPSGGSGRGRRDTWATHTGFILACVGSAVGMANIWLFPYRVASWAARPSSFRTSSSWPCSASLA